MEGPGSFQRPKGARQVRAGLKLPIGRVSSPTPFCLNAVADTDGLPTKNIRYDTPTWRGFSASTSYGEDNLWDIALKYAGDWSPVKKCDGGRIHEYAGQGASRFRTRERLWQIGAFIMRTLSGLWIYGTWEMEEQQARDINPGFASHQSRTLGSPTASFGS